MGAFGKVVAAYCVVLAVFRVVLVIAEEDSKEPTASGTEPSEVDEQLAKAARTIAGATASALKGATTASATGDRDGLVSQLIIDSTWGGPADPFPFDDAGAAPAKPVEVLFEGRATKDRFSCDVQPSDIQFSTLASEPSTVAVRRFRLWRAQDKSLLDKMGFGASDQPEAGVWVTNGRLRVLSADGLQEDSTTLIADLASPLPDGTKIGAADDENVERENLLTVEYICRVEGRAVVELRLQAEGSDGSRRSICLRWAKKCTTGWANLKIEESEMGGAVVFANGQIQEDWKTRMNSEGTHQPVTKFLISADGIEQIRRPAATSNQQLLSVDLTGPLTVSDKNEISMEPITLSVQQVCNFDGFADVTLVLEKVTCATCTEEPEPLIITYKKVCGVATFRHFDVHIKSEFYKNRTQAVSQGDVLPGFLRSCRAGELVMNPSLRKHQEKGEQCDRQPPLLVISEKELRTTLELDTEKGSFVNPVFSPPPDITFDHKVLRVSLLSTGLLTHGAGVPSRGKGSSLNAKKRQILQLKYTCYQDGESIVMMTLHIQSYKSIHLAWRKKCTEPKAKVGKALTAPQAIMVTMFVCGVIVMVVCLCFMFYGSSPEKEDKKPRKKPYSRADISDDDGGDIELPAKVGKAQADEVVYHS